MEDLILYEIIGFFLFTIVCMYNFKEFQITSEVEQPNFVRPSREYLERKVRKRLQN